MFGLEQITIGTIVAAVIAAVLFFVLYGIMCYGVCRQGSKERQVNRAPAPTTLFGEEKLE